MRNLLRVWAFVGTQFIVSAPAIADAPDTLWTKTYGGTDCDWGNSVQECVGGGFIIAGTTYSFSADFYNVYLIRTNSDGDTLWTKIHRAAYSGGYSVQECVGGGFIIAGRTGPFGDGTGDDVYLIRTDADGDKLWTKTYGDMGPRNNVGMSVQECAPTKSGQASGGFIIAGVTGSFGGDVWLIRTDADGDTLWTKTYGGTEYDRGYSVQECASGGFIIAGTTESFGAGYSDVYLIRTNADGDTLWTKTYGGTDRDYGRSVQECASGGFIIAGRTESFGAGYDVYLIRTNADGAPLWTKTYGGTHYDYGNSVQECAGGGFIIAGRTESFGAGDWDVYLIRTDADGVPLWTKTYGGSDYDCGYSIQECASGGFIIAGATSSFGAGDFDVWLIRISDAGVEEQKELRVESLELRVYPNPFIAETVVRGRLSCSDQHELPTRITIYDLSGRLVNKVEGNTIGKNLKAGIYWLKTERCKPVKIVKLR